MKAISWVSYGSPDVLKLHQEQKFNCCQRISLLVNQAQELVVACCKKSKWAVEQAR